MIRILIVNQFLLMSNIFVSIFEDEPDIEVVGKVTTTGEALNLASDTDVILVDIKLSNRGAYKLTRAISQAGYSTKVVVLGISESREQVLQYIQAGAAGYVLKDDSVKVLLERVRDIHVGRVKISPQIASALMTRLSEYSQYLHQVKNNGLHIADLTRREMEILELIGEGLTNQEIANRLIIELGTAKNHVHNILQKMGASTRREAAASWTVARNGGRKYQEH